MNIAVSSALLVLLRMTASGAAPAVTSVTNAASLVSGPIAPGELISIAGSGFGSISGTISSSSEPLPTTLAGVSVTIGGTALGLESVSSTQIMAVAPAQLQANASFQLIVQAGSALSAPYQITAAVAAPGVFTADASGQGEAMAFTANSNAPISSSNPAAPGSFVVVYFTGGGQTTASGSFAETVVVGLNNAGVAVSYAGSTPNLAGYDQVTIQIPSNSNGMVSFSIGIVTQSGTVFSQAGVTITTGTAQTTCTQTKLVPAVTSPSSATTLTSGFPISLGVTLVDNCGNAINSASVAATFSNGDPPVALSSSGNGRYSGTWTPGNVQSQTQVVVQFLAQAAGLGSASTSVTVGGLAITAINPVSTTAGGGAFALTVTGSGFASGAVVDWNGSALSTTFVSATQLAAVVPASLIATAGTASITVISGGVSSAASTFTITAASAGPAITSISPSFAAAGSPSLTVTITGSGFVSGARVQFNGLSLSTSFVSPTTLTAQIPAGDLLSAGTGQITVQSPTGPASNSVAFLVSSTSALQFLTVAPCRVLDTRLPPTSIYPINSTFGSPYIAAGMARTIPIPASTNCPVPSNAAAYSLNFTVQPRTTTLGSLTVWPAGTAQPNVSTLSFSNPAVVLAAAGIVPAGASGAVNATATQDIDLIVDINGYFVPPTTGTLQFYPLPPCRVLDTRTPANSGTFPANSTFGSPALDGVHARSFPIPSSTCGAPASASAYSFNVGVVPNGPLYFLAAYPTGGTLPVVSTMNSFDGTILANAAIVPAAAGGAVNFFASNPTDFFVDINGYFAPPGSGGLNFYTVAPCRLVDTRNANGTFGGPTFSADTIRSFPLPQSPCGIPSGTAVQAYSLGITVYPVGGGLYYLTTWPTGGAQPFASTLNAIKPLLPIANAALVPAGTGGAINVFVTNPTDVTIDTSGYFGP